MPELLNKSDVMRVINEENAVQFAAGIAGSAVSKAINESRSARTSAHEWMQTILLTLAKM